MKPTTFESHIETDPIIGLYVEYEGEMPPFVLDTQIMPRPLSEIGP